MQVAPCRNINGSADLQTHPYVKGLGNHTAAGILDQGTASVSAFVTVTVTDEVACSTELRRPRGDPTRRECLEDDEAIRGHRNRKKGTCNLSDRVKASESESESLTM